RPAICGTGRDAPCARRSQARLEGFGKGAVMILSADPLAWSLPLGAALDAWLGDPQGWPHPVRLIGRLIQVSERGLRRLAGRAAWAQRAAGVVLVVVVAGLTAAAAWGAVALGGRFGAIGTVIVQAVLIYWGLAARSLGAETLRAVEASDLAAARRALA